MNLKNILIISCIILISAPAAFSQKKKDALYLKNGSIIFGELVEVKDNTYTILTRDGSTFVYSSDEVAEFSKAEIIKDYDPLEGIGIGFEAGFLVGPQRSDMPAPFSFMVNLAYRYTNIHSFGFGSGVEYLGSSYTPVTFDYRYYIREERVTPYFLVRGGAMLNFRATEESDAYYYDERDYQNGYTGSIGMGVRWARDNYENYVSFAYRHARTSYTVEEWYGGSTSTYKTNWNRLEIKVGISF